MKTNMPWTIERNTDGEFSIIGDGYILATVANAAAGQPVELSKAERIEAEKLARCNAELIASAPTLKARVQELEGLLSEYMANHLPGNSQDEALEKLAKQALSGKGGARSDLRITTSQSVRGSA